MYTRCPTCNCTFRVTAAVLQMAEGEVRCGSCGGVFNALRTLVDDVAATDRPAAPADDSLEPDADPTLEFNAPEDEWQRFFITPREPPAPPRPDPGLGEEFDSPDEPAGAGAQPPPDEDAAEAPWAPEPVDFDEPPRSLEEETADTGAWREILREVETGDSEGEEPPFVVADDAEGAGASPVFIRRPAEPRPPPEPASAGPKAPAGEGAGDRPAEPEIGTGADSGPDIEAIFGDEAAAPGEVDAAARSPETVLDWGPATGFPSTADRAPARSRRWLAASAIAAIALGAQVAHHFRDVLAADPVYGPYVRAAYARLGVTLYPAWPLAAYDIRGAKAIAENSAPGALDIVAGIAVSGVQPVGAPILRVVLRDRYSNPVGSGVFEATRYLAEPPPASGVYPPGTLIPVQISVRDPGSAAQGYELDVCIPDRKLGLQCKAARDPFAR